MRQIFNKKQLIVMWFVGILICIFLVSTSVAGSPRFWTWGWGYIRRHIDWNLALLYPVIIIGALLVITFSGRQSPEEEKAKKE